jgi:hypothetical protein
MKISAHEFNPSTGENKISFLLMNLAPVLGKTKLVSWLHCFPGNKYVINGGILTAGGRS